MWKTWDNMKITGKCLRNIQRVGVDFILLHRRECFSMKLVKIELLKHHPYEVQVLKISPHFELSTRHAGVAIQRQ